MTSTGAKSAPHVPVLVSQVIDALAIQHGETVVDGTFGAGGYTRAMLAAGASKSGNADHWFDGLCKRLLGDARVSRRTALRWDV